MRSAFWATQTDCRHVKSFVNITSTHDTPKVMQASYSRCTQLTKGSHGPGLTYHTFRWIRVTHSLEDASSSMT
jgi:hypothetical protein